LLVLGGGAALWGDAKATQAYHAHNGLEGLLAFVVVGSVCMGCGSLLDLWIGLEPDFALTAKERERAARRAYKRLRDVDRLQGSPSEGDLTATEAERAAALAVLIAQEEDAEREAIEDSYAGIMSGMGGFVVPLVAVVMVKIVGLGPVEWLLGFNLGQPYDLVLPMTLGIVPGALGYFAGHVYPEVARAALQAPAGPWTLLRCAWATRATLVLFVLGIVLEVTAVQMAVEAYNHVTPLLGNPLWNVLAVAGCPAGVLVIWRRLALREAASAPAGVGPREPDQPQ
jgi:hypothetical protein